MKDRLRHILQGRIVIVGMGNPLRGDDGFGPALAVRLKDRIQATCVDAGTSPENYAGKIAKEEPDVVLIVDAVCLGRRPGECEILEKSDIVKSGFTTHDISPKMLIEYLEGLTKARIYMLGLQPQNTFFGSEMSAPVRKTLQEVEELIKEVVHARVAFD